VPRRERRREKRASRWAGGFQAGAGVSVDGESEAVELGSWSNIVISEILCYLCGICLCEVFAVCRYVLLVVWMCGGVRVGRCSS
jgi:hypothetical protein